MTAPTTLSLNTGTGQDRAAASGHRADIQGLRAVAVLAVVLFHLWPNRLSGGFVGVDVFFVISGFLITAHMFREVRATGTLSLRRFWARRIRRLLPASLLVLGVSALATVAFLPATVWSTTARQIAASALYVQNWALAGDAVDYMAQDNEPTLAQHYWSLSVEEQFYAGWPLVVLVIVVIARVFGRAHDGAARAAMIVGLGAIGTGSLVWSVLATHSDQSQAYFVTPTRVWEFAVGAVIALIGVPQPRRSVAAALSFAGLLAIGAAAVAFDGASLFPGWIALLPVLGAAAVIVGGSTGHRFTPGWWLSTRPMTFVGDVSYSVYLWHWPLIVVLPHVTGVSLRTADKLGILALTILLAWLSKVYVEDPMRIRPLLAARPWRSYAFAVTGMAVVVAGTVAITLDVDRRAEAAAIDAAAILERAPECAGPAALDDPTGCAPITGAGPLVPPPEVVARQNSRPTYPDCQQSITKAAVMSCTLGSTSADPDRVVAIVGDSHATHWFSAFDRLGKERNWRVLTFAKSSCPATTARRLLPEEQTGEAADSCLAWAAAVRDRIAGDHEISYVFTSAYSSAYEFTTGEVPLDEPATDGFVDVWSAWTQAGKEVFAIRDVPIPESNVPNCLAAHAGEPRACGIRAETLEHDPLADAARAADDPLVHLIDLTDRFCADGTCYAVVGNLIVYRDYSHLSDEYSTALVPYLGRQIDATVAAAP